MPKNCINNNPVFSSTQLELADEKRLASMAKALSHPARVRILKILLTLDKVGSCLNSDLVSQLGLAQSTVSEHLRILKAAEFISAEPKPPKVCYRVNQERLSEFCELFNNTLD